MNIKKFLITISVIFSLGMFGFVSINNDVRADEQFGIQNSVDMRETLESLKTNPNVQVSVSGDDFTITFSDSTLYSSAYSNNLINRNSRLVVPYSNGVKKITGNIASGKFKVYLTGNSLRLIKSTGASAISTYLGGGLGFFGSTIYNIITNEKDFSHGRVFVFANYQFQYWYYQ